MTDEFQGDNAERPPTGADALSRMKKVITGQRYIEQLASNPPMTVDSLQVATCAQSAELDVRI